VYVIRTKYKGTVEIKNREDLIGCKVIITCLPSMIDLEWYRLLKLEVLFNCSINREHFTTHINLKKYFY
jgi:hypothetical protein